MSNKHTLVKREIVESIRAVEEARRVEPKRSEGVHSFSVGVGSNSVASRLSPEALALIKSLKAEYFGK